MLEAHEVEALRRELREEGVKMDGLLDDLLDHLCTGIEEEMEAGEDFETAYARLRERMMPEGASEIQQATEYLLHYPIIIMRKIVFVSGFAWLFLWLLAAVFNMFHWPGGGALVMLSGLILGVVTLPSYMLYRLRSSPATDLLGRVTGYIAGPTGLLIASGCFFKLMHWPGANVLMISGMLILLGLFMPLVFIWWFRQERHTQTI